MADDISTIQIPSLRPSRGAGPVRFTWDDVLAMDQAGLFGETDRVELMDGELIIMPEEGPLHRMVVQVLQRWLLKQCGEDFELYVRGSLKVSGNTTYLIPDITVMDANFAASDCDVANAHLVIEVSDSTLRYDAGKKVRHYAKAGVREFWVVDANANAILMHREPQNETFASIITVQAGRVAIPLFGVGVGFDPAQLPKPSDFE